MGKRVTEEQRLLAEIRAAWADAPAMIRIAGSAYMRPMLELLELLTKRKGEGDGDKT